MLWFKPLFFTFVQYLFNDQGEIQSAVCLDFLHASIKPLFALVVEAIQRKYYPDFQLNTENIS